MANQNTFSYTPSKILMLLSAFGVAITMMSIVIFGLNPNKPKEGETGSIVYPPTLAALATGCGDYFRWDTEPKKHYAYLTDEEFEEAAFVPQLPVNILPYGYMAETPMSKADTNSFITSEDLQGVAIPYPTILRTLFDYDVTIIWYDPEDPILMIDVRGYVSEHENVMALPWLYTDRQIPLDRKIAFSKWGITQSCSNFSVGTVNDFVEFTQKYSVAHEETPPHAQLNENKTVDMLYVGPYSQKEWSDKIRRR